jgi:hypothetical protein
MMERVPLMDHANWQEEGGDRWGVVWVAVDSGERKINTGVMRFGTMGTKSPGLSREEQGA